MKKYIHLKKEDREFIAKAFGITPRMVFSAVHFESDSELLVRYVSWRWIVAAS